MTPRILAAAALAALTLSTSAYADAGSPDPHFGTNGVQRLDTTGGQYESAVALLADGKLIVTNRGPNDEHALIHRLNENGTIDDGFGTVTVDGTGIDLLNAVLVQPDGKILVGGRSNNSAVLYRFTAAGAPDPGFGIQGKVTLPALSQLAETVGSIALRDGKIVAGGQSALKAAVWKRNAVDGSADGATTIPIAGGGDNPFGDAVSGVVIQPDGKIDVSGTTSSSFNGFVARLTTGLALDPTFQGGLVPLSNGQVETGSSLVLQPDGKIVVVGSTFPNFANPVSDIMVTRLSPLGLLDPTFNGVGRRFIDSGTSETASKALLQPDGKIVIVGSNGDVLFYRLTDTGGLDPSFDGDGARGIDAGASDGAMGAVLQPDGRIVVVGFAGTTGFAMRVFGDPLAVAVDKDGTGKGAVVTDPIGLNCGVTCTAKFDVGTRVTLTAVPNPGSHFAGWRGCASTGATCTFDLRVPTRVTAVFDANTTTNGGGGTAGAGATTGGGGGTSGAGTPPAITGATLSATRFRVSSRKTAISAVKRGTSVRYTLSADAATTLTIAKGGRTVMTITRAKTTRGANLIAFTGRTAKKALKPGRYTLTLVAANATGRSRPVTLSFSVLSGR
jgi:uncharacterized delta-60 repeat protein